MKTVIRLAALALALAGASGCRTSSMPRSEMLGPQDSRLADALAHYAHGLLSENEHGRQANQTVSAFEQAALLAPHHYEIHFELALAHVAREEPEQAQAVLAKFARLNPEHARSLLDLAALTQAIGDEDAAVAHYRAALARKPTDTRPYMELARLLLARSMNDEALLYLDQALARGDDPATLRFVLSRGQSFLDESRPGLAARCFDLASSHRPEIRTNETFLLLFGAAYEQAELFDKAEAVFLDGLKQYPQSHQMSNYLAYMWAEQNKRLDEALVLIRQALKAQPDNGAYVDTLGWIYYRQGQFDKARDQLEKAHRLLPGDPVVADHLGDVYRALDEMDKAIRFWEKSHSLDPANKETKRKLQESGIPPSP